MRSAILGAILYFTTLTGAWAAAPELSHQQFESQIRSAVSPLAGKEIAGLKVLYLSNDVGPWIDTGLALKANDRVTVVLAGKIWLSRAYNLSFDAPIAVWAKVGQHGPIFRGNRETNTFVPDHDGALQLKTYPGQRWLDSSGNYLGAPAPVNPDAGGGVSVAIIQWANGVNVLDQLRKISALDPAATWALAELTRQQTPQKMPPDGWQYLWELGASEVFTEVRTPSGAGAPDKAIELHTHNDVAILRRDTPFALTPTTTLQWKWKADALPGAASENSAATHDYMSIAVEFDNGQDLTFFWSKDLPVGEHFHCPLPGWDHRETHVVTRSGTADLGKWLSEEENLFANYKTAVGGEMPKRIVRVWLIGVSLFQKGEGKSQFGEMVLKDGSKKVQVW